MLFQRVLTVAIVLPLLLAALFLLPNLYWGALLVLVIAGAAWEWGRLARYTVRGRSVFCAVVCGSAVAILYWDHAGLVQPIIYAPSGQAMYALAAAFWICIAPAWLYYHWRVRNPWLLALVGWIVMMPCWYAMIWLQLSPARLLL